jgi:hypothetical protein
MRALRTFASALGITVMLVVGVDYAATAATGRPLILGKINKSGAQSTLQRTKPGPALKLTTRSSANPPLATNGRGLVANLNADLVDGLDGASLQNGVIRYTLPTSTGKSRYTWDLPGLPEGTYLATFSVSATGAGFGVCRLEGGPASIGTPFGTEFTMTGSGVITRTAGLQLTCFSDQNFTVDTRPEGPTELTFTRIDSLQSATAVLGES